MNKTREIEEVKKDLINLKKSPLYKYRKENNYSPVIGEGSLNAKIVFIGEAPGKNEAIIGKPFCGASGKVLDELLDSIKLKRKDVYITNIVNDRPENNRDPKLEEINLYFPFLLRQLEIIKPKVIVSLGRLSMKEIMKKFDLQNKIDSISKIHGKKFKIKTSWGEVFFVPLFHPAVALYNRNKLKDLKKDFNKLKSI